jgi:hypothetical protein
MTDEADKDAMRRAAEKLKEHRKEVKEWKEEQKKDKDD